MMNDLEFDKQHIWHPYTKIPATIDSYLVESAQGVLINLLDKKGNKHQCIDGMSSWWSVIHGYNHPQLNKAIINQLDNMAHIMFGGLTHKPAIELAQKLTQLTKLDKVFFADSGSIAVEVALKMSLQFFQDIPEKRKFITLNNGYHGDTLATMSVSDSGGQALFKQNLMDVFFVEVNDVLMLEQKLKKHANEIAAMVLEPIVQGAGGMRFYEAEYLKAVRELCTKYNVLLIIDEIATGFGRTGKLFACEYAQIIPDIMCVGKALTGGYLSLAASITTQKISDKVGVLMHGPTFMANPLACSVANVSIDVLLNSPWQQNIANIELGLKEGLNSLKKHKKVADVRVMGAIGIVEMKDNVDIEKTQKSLIKKGVWLRPFGKLLYTMPPFITTTKQIETITQAMRDSI
jgi:adenosylmethionine-8-amino-7-oxononanoate aminotransferase